MVPGLGAAPSFRVPLPNIVPVDLKVSSSSGIS